MQVILIAPWTLIGNHICVIIGPVLNQDIMFKTSRSADAIYSHIRNANDENRLRLLLIT